MSSEKIQRWISLEGTPGAGKSTFLDKVIEHLPTTNIVKIGEPVGKWIASGLLQKSYENPIVYGFATQVHIFTTRIEEHNRIVCENPNASIFFSDRSPIADKLFWNVNVALGRVPSDLGPVYLDAWKLWQRCMDPRRNPDCFIYLNTPAVTCFERMNSRGRLEENSVTLSYLESLETAHTEQFMDHGGALMSDGTRVPVIVVDGSLDFRLDHVAKKIAQQISTQLNLSDY